LCHITDDEYFTANTGLGATQAAAFDKNI
jgi:hypothetical protein